jgi:glutamate transport system permease protein
MSASVLFDAPGPRTRARHRLYTVLVLVALVVLVGLAIWRLNDKGQFAYSLWEPLITPKYDRVILTGLRETLEMAALAVLGAVVFGVVFGVGKLSDHAWVRWPSWLVVEFFRAVPVLLLMVLFFYSYGVHHITGHGPYWCVVWALTLYNGSVLAEVFRAGILAVPHGQAEAAYALGLRKTQVMTIVLLPQAVKIMLPAIISQCVVALKDTSLGFYIVAPGLTAVNRSIYLEFHNQVQSTIVIAGIYVVVNLILTGVAVWVQRKFVGEKKIDVMAMVGPAAGDDVASRTPAGGGI